MAMCNSYVKLPEGSFWTLQSSLRFSPRDPREATLVSWEPLRPNATAMSCTSTLVAGSNSGSTLVPGGILRVLSHTRRHPELTNIWMSLIRKAIFLGLSIFERTPGRLPWIPETMQGHGLLIRIGLLFNVLFGVNIVPIKGSLTTQISFHLWRKDQTMMWDDPFKVLQSLPFKLIVFNYVQLSLVRYEIC